MKGKYKVLGMVSFFVLVLVLAVYALTSVNSPTTCSGQWTTCTNANANDASRATATATNTANFSGIWRDYGFSISDSSSIDSVIVRPDFFASNVRGFAKIRVSGDGGATYGPIHTIGGNTAEQSYFIDVTSDLAWTGSMLNNANLRINATCFKDPQSGSNPTCRLDWIPVNVTYTPFDFSVSASPSSDTVAQGVNATTAVTVDLLSGNSQNVFLFYSGCPINTSCSFNPTNGNPTYASEFKVVTAINAGNGTVTPLGTYTITLSGFSNGMTRNTNYTLTVV